MSDAVTDLFAAVHANNPGGVRLLVGAEPELLHSRSPSGLSPVMFAAYYHRPQVLDVLLAAGPELDVFEAAATGQTLPENADVNAFNPDGLTPLHLAAMFGRTGAAQVLLDSGADLHAVSQNPQGAQPLHSALGGRQWNTARLLLERGADVGAAQPGGWTPLLLAVGGGEAELVGELLSRGADPHARTDEGQSAADLAREDGHGALLEQFPVLTLPQADLELQAELQTGPQTAQENSNVPLPRSSHNALMDELNKTAATGTVTTHTDAGTDSARDVHQASYTTTPLDSRVSSSNEGLGGAVGLDMPDPKEVTGQFDHLATRDPEAMDQHLQAPEFEGAQTTVALDTGVLGSLVGANDVALMTTADALSGTAVGRAGGLNPDPNSGYTAPALSGPPHVSEQPGDLPPGETQELKAQIENR